MRFVFNVIAVALLALVGVTLHAQEADPLPSETRVAEGAQVTPSGLHFSSREFDLSVQTHLQFRFTHQQEVANSGRGGTNGRNFNNFRVARAATTFRGHIYSPEFRYHVRLAWSRPAHEMLEIAHFRWALLREVNFNAGQHKIPFSWEQIVGPHLHQFNGFSHVDAVFNQDFGKGIWVDGRMFGVDYNIGLYNGVLRANDDFRNADVALTQDAYSVQIDGKFMINMRLEMHPFGRVEANMNDRRDSSSNGKFLLAGGVAANWFSSGVENSDLRGDTAATATGSGRSRVWQDTWALTADVHLRWFGFSIDAVVFWRHTEFHNRGSNRYRPQGREGISNLTDFGAGIEASYYLAAYNLSFGVRFNHTDSDEFWGRDSSLNFTRTRQRAIRPDVTEYGVSVNYFIHGDHLKASLDVLYVHQQLAFSYRSAPFLRGVYNDPPSRRGALGSHPENADHNVLWIVRLQLQWMF